MDSHKKPQIDASFSYMPQEETLAIAPRHESLFIGIPREEKYNEKRVPLTPSAVQVLVSNGHSVYIEHKAGLAAFFADKDYSEAGAKICYDKKEIYEANLIIKFSPVSEEEIGYMKPQQIVVAPFPLSVMNTEITEKLKDKRVICLNIGSIKDDAGYYPIVRSMSEIAGAYAINTAVNLLTNNYGGKGLLLGSVSGVPASNVVILGAGVVGQTAARIARGLGCNVKVFDNNLYKLMRLQRQIQMQVDTCVIDPATLALAIENADAVIGALKPKAGVAPLVVSEAMVANMREGSVIVDVSIDSGGCIETSKVTTHEKPTYETHGVTHYCVPNIASGVARTASMSISNILMPLLLDAGKQGGFHSTLAQKQGLRHAVILYNGTVTGKALAKKLGIGFTDINLLFINHQ